MTTREIITHLDSFSGISLEEMDGVKLMTRSDVKYLCHIDQLPAILEAARDHYQVLEHHNRRLLGYETLYFDTADNEMYRKHHNRKRNRYKVRVREYQASGEFFLEVKYKRNTGVTQKVRMPVNPDRDIMQPEASRFIAEHSEYRAEALEPRLFSQFQRTTLVSIPLVERITIDILPNWFINGLHVELPYLVIMELKGQKFTNTSGFGKILREARIQRKRLNKYCTGVNLLYPEEKHNRFKVKMLHLKKLDKSKQYAHHFTPFA